MEKIFKEKFKNFRVNLKVIHKADQEDLFRELNSKTNDAIFWLSHGSFSKMRVKGEQALGVTPMIFDYQGDNVADIFSSISSNVEYVAIIGCNTKGILDYYKKENQLTFPENLNTYVAGRKVIANFGLKRAIRNYKKLWKKGLLKKSTNKNTHGYKISIKRYISPEHQGEKIRSIKVINNKKVIAVLPKMNPGSEVNTDILIPAVSNFAKSKFHLEFSTSQNIYKESEHFVIGDIEVSNEIGSIWKLFTKPNGEAFGVNSKLYLFKDDESILNTLSPIL